MIGDPLRLSACLVLCLVVIAACESGAASSGVDTGAIDASVEDAFVEPETGAPADATTGEGGTDAGDDASMDAGDSSTDASPGDASLAPVALGSEGCPPDTAACNGQCLAVGQSAGGCTRLWGSARALAVLDDALFVGTQRELLRVSLDTLEVQVLSKDGTTGDLVAAAGELYAVSGTSLAAVDPDGGARQVLADTGISDDILHLQVVGEEFYFGIENIMGGETLTRLPVAGGMPETVLDDVEGALVVGDRVYYAQSLQVGSPQFPGYSLYRDSLPGLGDAQLVVEGGVDPFGLVAEGGYVYWNDYGAVRRLDPTTGDIERVTLLERPATLAFISAQPGLAFYRSFRNLAPGSSSELGSAIRVRLGSEDSAESQLVFEGADGVRDALQHDGQLFVAASGGSGGLGAGLFRLAAP